MIIAVIFDCTNEKHSRTEEANHIKLLRLKIVFALPNEQSEN